MYESLQNDGSSPLLFCTVALGLINVAKGSTGYTCTPKAKKFFSGPNLQGKVVSAPPRQSKSPIFLGNLRGVDSGRGYFGIQF